MRIRLLTATTLISRLLCAACIVLWLVSYRWDWAVGYGRYDSRTLRWKSVVIETDGGRVGLSCGTTDYCLTPRATAVAERRPPRSGFMHLIQDHSGASLLHGLWFDGWLNAKLNSLTTYSEILVPWWFPACLLVILPAIRWRRRRRPLAGCCVSCGYDLRASNERCPECGTPIPSKASA